MNRQQRRVLKNYPAGVTDEPSPFWDFQKCPWDYYSAMGMQMLLAWLVIKNMRMDKDPVQVRLLDVACGYGELRQLLLRYRKAKDCRLAYVGIDLDEDKREIALEKNSRIDYRIKDVRDVADFSETPFDVVVSSETLEHLSEKDGKQFLTDLPKALKPGGLLVLTTPTQLYEKHRRDKWHLHIWESADVLGILATIGMQIQNHFFLRVPKRAWSIDTKNRIPNQLASVAMSVLADGAQGGTLFVIARKNSTKEENFHEHPKSQHPIRSATGSQGTLGLIYQ